MAGKVIHKSLTAVVSTEAAVGLEVRRMVPAAIARGESVELQIASTSPLPPTPLTPEAQDHANFLVQLIAAYVGMKFESPEAMLIVGLVLYLTMIEFARLRARG